MEAIERETYINFSDAEDTATLCTFNRAWLTRMDELAAKTNSVQIKTRRDNYGEYLFPKKFVKVKISHPVDEKERERLTKISRERFTKKSKEV